MHYELHISITGVLFHPGDCMYHLARQESLQIFTFVAYVEIYQNAAEVTTIAGLIQR